LAFGQFSLRPWIERIEDAHNRLLTTEGLPSVFVKLNLDALLRASLSERYASYQTGVAAGFLTVNEARRLEDLPPVPSTIDTNAVEAVGALIRSGFDPASALKALGLPPIEHTGAAPVTVQRMEDVV
jgi:phage portal protein BeeE